MNTLADDTRWMDATAQAVLVAAGEVRPGDLVAAAIERIEAHDGPVNAVAIRWFAEALDHAAAGVPDGSPFAGVPTLLKDLHVHEAGRPLTNGNRALRAAPPISATDCELTRRIRRAGLVTVGRSTSCELGSLPVTESAAYGRTRNPWSLGVTSGGSSGGAAAAVAAGFVPVAHASDGGGSIRIPASCCGLVGLKPSQGRVSLGPVRSESGLGIDFFVTRSVRDVAALLDAVAGPGVGDTVVAPAPVRPFAAEVGADPGRLRIGMLDHRPGVGPVDPECAAAAQECAARLEALGHHVEPAWPAPMSDPTMDGVFFALWSTSRATGIAQLGRMLGRPLTEDEVEGHNWVMAELAEHVGAVAYADASTSVASFRRSMLAWWSEGFDLLLSPTLSTPPITVGSLDAPDDNPLATMVASNAFVGFTGQFNMSGQPAISIPGRWNDDGVPIGVQLVADYGREDVLIRVASQLEQAHPWADRHPEV